MHRDAVPRPKQPPQSVVPHPDPSFSLSQGARPVALRVRSPRQPKAAAEEFVLCFSPSSRGRAEGDTHPERGARRTRTQWAVPFLIAPQGDRGRETTKLSDSRTLSHKNDDDDDDQDDERRATTNDGRTRPVFSREKKRGALFPAALREQNTSPAARRAVDIPPES